MSPENLEPTSEGDYHQNRGRLSRLIGRFASRLFPKGDDDLLPKDKVVTIEQLVDTTLQESDALDSEYLDAIKRSDDLIFALQTGTPPAFVASEVFLQDRPAHEIDAVVQKWAQESQEPLKVLQDDTSICRQHGLTMRIRSKLDFTLSVQKAEETLFESLRSTFWRDYMG